MKISKIRSFLYGSAKILGDISALKSGNISKIKNRIFNRLLGKSLSTLFKR